MMNKRWKLLIAGIAFPVVGFCQYPGQHRDQTAVTTKAQTKAYSFDLQDVRLLDSRFRENMVREGNWMLSLPVERLLYSFRVNAGMLTNNKTNMPKPLAGWEGLDVELRGHSIGHLLSGLSLQFAATGDQRFKLKVDSIVTGLAEVQKTLNQGGYLSAFPQHYIDRCIAGKSVWAPWYTLHKITAGLIDAYWYAGNQQALDMVKGMADWAYHKLAPLSPDQLQTMLKNEFGGMNEAWYNLYSITGNPDHKKLGDLFYHHAVLDPLADRQDKLYKMHANTIIPKITGEARAYELTGETRDKEIVEYFWEDIIKNQTYVTGSNSDKEHFIEPGKISKYITGYTGESCNTYNMLKLTRHLFCWAPEVKYADYYERALYNHMLGQQDPKTGMVCYFTPLKAGSYRLYSTRDSSFWCCVGSSFESQSKYGEAIYYHDAQGIFVNLFIPSILTWKEKKFELKQETNYPEEATTRLSVTASSGKSVPLYIRYPQWASNGAIVKVNGRPITISQKCGSYITLNRKWQKGDRIEVTYPMTLRLEATPDNPKVAAVMYGPILLAAPMGTKDMVKPAPYHDPSVPSQYYNYDYHIPADIIHTLHIGNQNISDVLKRAPDKPLIFSFINEALGSTITMEPYYNLHRERYVVYWDLDQP